METFLGHDPFYFQDRSHLTLVNFYVYERSCYIEGKSEDVGNIASKLNSGPTDFFNLTLR